MAEGPGGVTAVAEGPGGVTAVAERPAGVTAVTEGPGGVTVETGEDECLSVASIESRLKGCTPHFLNPAMTLDCVTARSHATENT